MDYLDIGINALLTPLGALAVVAAILAVFAGATWPIARWLIFGAVVYFASLGKLVARDGTVAPPLAPPFELLVQNGRPITVAALGVVAAFALMSPASRRTRTPIGLFFLLLAAIYLDLKIYLVNPTFAMLSLAIYALVFFVMTRTVAVWLGWERDLRRPATALLLVGAIFSASVFYQMRFGLLPIAFDSGRLNGTTANPQLAGIILASILPAAIYMLLRVRRNLGQLTAVLALTAALVCCLLWTGSRTAIIMAMCGTAAFLVRRPRILAVLGVGAALLLIFNLDSLFVETTIAQRFSTGENTRINVWNSLYRTFSTYPVFGAPLEGDRIGFGESSWLAMAATGGVAGLAPLAIFAVALGLMMFRVFRAPVRGFAAHDRDFVLAGWATLMVGSIAEAYLLGVVSAPVLLLYLYALMGRRHLDLVERQAAAMYRPAPAMRRLARAPETVARDWPGAADAWDGRRDDRRPLPGDPA